MYSLHFGKSWKIHTKESFLENLAQSNEVLIFGLESQIFTWSILQ